MCENKTAGGCGGGCGGRELGLMAEAVREMLLPTSVLGTYSDIIPASGYLQLDHFHAPFAAVAVNVVSVGANGLTLQAGQASGALPPPSGAGIAYVPANKGGVFHLRGNALTVWGTAGDKVTVQAFTKPQPVAWG